LDPADFSSGNNPAAGQVHIRFFFRLPPSWNRPDGRPGAFQAFFRLFAGLVEDGL
jgi:hypothetical protein